MVLSSGVGTDALLRPRVIVRTCWSWAALTAFAFTAVGRCRPGVGRCSSRCGYDRGMGHKALGLQIYGSSAAPWGSEVRDRRLCTP